MARFATLANLLGHKTADILPSIVYSSGNAAIAENVGRRLENFFWRIAMCERLRERLSGAQIDRQFDSISQGGRIRTTPTPSPRSSRNLGNSVQQDRSITSTKSAVSVSSASPKAELLLGNEDIEDTSITPTPQSPRQASPETTIKPKVNRRTTSTRPPPILKKLSSGSNRPSRSSSIVSPASQGSWTTAGTGIEGDVAFDDDPTPTEPHVSHAGRSARKSNTTRFNEEVAVSIPKASTISRPSGSRLSGESNQRSGRRNPIVVASTGASKRRPPIMRQRSAQTSSFGALKEPPSRTSSSPNLALSTTPHTAKGPSQEAGSSSAERLRAASPHPSRNRKGSSPSPPSSNGTAEDFGCEDVRTQVHSTNPHSKYSVTAEVSNTSSEVYKPLVDPNFRSQFVDKTQPSNRSFTNIPSFARKAGAALPTAASFQASGMLDTGQGSPTAGGRTKGKEAFKNEIIPLKGPASAGPESPAENLQPLPRTKSQLTLLLEREKNRSAGQEP